ncbi:MAG TPA: DUF4019 domain-containing protein [Pyrinomonadaceae bacterium]|nr:DUF4019 domain-containing protein [Pyrinomonadaceae bacterium]
MKTFSRSGATAQRKTRVFRCAVAPLRERSCSEKRHLSIFLIFLSSLTVSACRQDAGGGRVPAEVNEVIASVGENITQERYEQIYNESSDLWKKDVTLDQSNEAFKTLRTKLGKVESRTLHSATEQQNSGGALKGHVYILTYQTKFERGDAMETFTLIEENGRWRMARYFVNSTALQ